MVLFSMFKRMKKRARKARDLNKDNLENQNG